MRKIMSFKELEPIICNATNRRKVACATIRAGFKLEDALNIREIVKVAHEYRPRAPGRALHELVAQLYEKRRPTSCIVAAELLKYYKPTGCIAWDVMMCPICSKLAEQAV